MDETPEGKKEEIFSFMESLSDLVGRKITGAAYSEKDGDPIIILNLIDEKTTLTSWYMPLDLKAFDRNNEV